MGKIHELNSAIFSAPAVGVYSSIFFSVFSPIGLGKMELWSSILVGFVFLGLLPLLIILLFARKYSIKIDIYDRKRRTPIFFIIIINYIFGSFIFWVFNNYTMFLIAFSYVVVTSAIMFINLFWKISVHTAGLTGPLTAMVYVFGSSLLPLFLLVVPVAYSRYKLESHNRKQLLAGVLVAIFITYIIYYFMW